MAATSKKTTTSKTTAKKTAVKKSTAKAPVTKKPAKRRPGKKAKGGFFTRSYYTVRDVLRERRWVILRWLCLALVVYALFTARYFIWPRMDALVSENPQTTAFMEYRAAQWKRDGKRVTLRRQWKPLSAISRNLQRAVVVAEDDLFWRHEGFDWNGITNALDKNLARGKFAAGGSTISQQLAKNLFLSPSKNITRKLSEAILTWRLERALSKERILEIYLNVVEWGDGIFGAEAAARKYFGVSAANLTAYQAATLAAMLPAPLKRTPQTPHVKKVADVIVTRITK